MLFLLLFHNSYTMYRKSYFLFSRPSLPDKSYRVSNFQEFLRAYDSVKDACASRQNSRVFLLRKSAGIRPTKRSVAFAYIKLYRRLSWVHSLRARRQRSDEYKQFLFYYFTLCTSVFQYLFIIVSARLFVIFVKEIPRCKKNPR